ncbi:MAG: tyrosine-protein phosphatase [Bacteroidota bacterium]
MKLEGGLKGAVDVHTHILPGMDDGAQSIEDARAMARTAEESGTQVIVATPHVDFAGAKQARAAEIVRSSADALQSALASWGLSIRILPGMEIAIDPHLLDLLRNGEALTIGDTGKFILVELPFQQVPAYTESVVFSLSSAGYIPVIAHPERCVEIEREPNLMYQLVRAGAIGQVNAGSLTGAFGRSTRRVAEALLRYRLAHVIASDGHSPTSRPCRLDQAFHTALQVMGRDAALRAVRDIPGAIVRGETVRLEDPERHVSRRWFMFWSAGGHR